jgi:DNA-binding IclR family transcriptional regulator
MWDVSVARSGRPGIGASGTNVGVVDRSVAILDAIEAGSRTFTDIVRSTGLNRSTTHRLLASLEAHGLVARVEGRGYRLGPRLYQLGAAAVRDLPLRESAHPALERLARATGEGAQLFVRSGDRRICLDVVESRRELRTIVEVGASLPLTAGSAGKVLMAWAPDLDRLLTRVERFTDRTPTGGELRDQLAAARRRGWAESAGEREPGVASVSAPVLGTGGDVVAAVSVSGPEQRLGAKPGRRHARSVVAAAREVEAAIGSVTGA